MAKKGKERGTFSYLYEWARPYRSRHLLSVLFAVLEVGFGTVPFVCLGKITELLVAGEFAFTFGTYGMWLLIVAFNYFYVAIQYNPVDIANQLRKNNGTIPGIRPGKPTSDFITKTLSKITLIGAVFLAIVAGFPIILGNITGTSIQLGGTTLLIVVGVALETGRSLEGYMTARYHKGFLE